MSIASTPWFLDPKKTVPRRESRLAEALPRISRRKAEICYKVKQICIYTSESGCLLNYRQQDYFS